MIGCERSFVKPSQEDISDFHDQHMVSVSLDDDTGTLGFKDRFGARSEVTLHLVEALLMNDFRQGNIVLDLEILEGEDALGAEAGQLLAQLFPEPHTAAPTEVHDRHRALIAGRTARLRSREAVLISISPSYGACLVAFCASISVTVGPS